MSASSKGSQREHAVKRQMEDAGWVVARCAGSHSAVDLWAMRYSEWTREEGATLATVKAIQVKGNSGSPWMNFRQREREELSDLAMKAGAIAWLVHWPPRGECRWIPEHEWPSRSAMLSER